MTETYKCPRCPDEALLKRLGILICANCDFQLPERMVEPKGTYEEGWGLEEVDPSN